MRRLRVLLVLSWVVLGVASPASARADGAPPPHAARVPPIPTVGRAPCVSPVGEPVRVVRPFRPPAVRWGAGHRGVDLAAGVGSVVRASGAGRVSFAGRLAGRGVVVVVHGVLRTTYEPVTATVRVGDRVAAGAPIGQLDAGHDPARPGVGLLHWGLLRGRSYLDPMSLLRGRPVRLLPHWDRIDRGRADIGRRVASASVVNADDRFDRRDPPHQADGGSMPSTLLLSAEPARLARPTTASGLLGAIVLAGAAAVAARRR